MNQFYQNHKSPQTKTSQRLKIKSRYFGQYEPQLFIASKSKSKSRSTSKDDLNNLLLKKPHLNSKITKPNNQNQVNQPQTILINPQSIKSPRSFNSGGLSEYLLTRSASPGRKKQGSAIEKIIEWVERKYFEKIKNQKIEKGTSLSILRENKYSLTNQQQKFQESLKKFAFNAFILSRLKSPRIMKLNSLPKVRISLNTLNKNSQFQSKQHDIDNINISPIKQVSKAEDFDIYKFKKNQNYPADVNLLRKSQLSIENINRSGHKAGYNNQNVLNKEEFSYRQQKIDISTMNSLENLEVKQYGRNQSQKDLYNYQIGSQNKAFFVQTARSISTNQILQISKNSVFQNSIQEKEKPSNSKEILKNHPLYEGELKKSIKIQDNLAYEKLKEKQQQNSIEKGVFTSMNSYDTNDYLSRQLNLNLRKGLNVEMKVANHLELMLKKKLKNQTGLCEIDFWPNAIFHPQKISQIPQPTEVNALNIVNGQSQQILNEIFQMNDDQQRILKTIGYKQNSVFFNSKYQQKTETIDKPESIINKIQANSPSQISRNRKSLAQNYFSLHLAVNEQPHKVKTYQMPLSKANTNLKVSNALNSHNSRTLLGQNNSPNKQVFTFNSLNPQNNTKNEPVKQKVSFQHKKQQTNAFTQKCNIFGLCSGQNQKQLQRSNYFTDMSTSGRQRGTYATSNQSKKSSKPKVRFNYISPSSKNIPVLAKQKQQQGSILFKSQASHLKNKGNAPVKIDIKPSRGRKQNEEITESIVKEVIPSQMKQLRSQSQVISQKERSQSVPHFTVQKIIPPGQQIKMEPIVQYSNIGTEKKIQPKNAFVSAGYGPSYYYQSQKVITNFPQTHPPTIQANYQSAQSYYFPGMISSNMVSSQLTNKVNTQVPSQTLIKEKETVSRNGHRYLYPIQNSVEKQRTERTKSLCEKIFVTVKKGQC